MPSRNPELPEGTDHIINGAAELGTGSTTGTTAGATGGPARASSGGDLGGGMTGASGTGGTGGFVGSAGSGLDTGGLSTGTGGSAALATVGTGGTAGDAGTGTVGALKAQAASGVQSLKTQATDKARSYALDGKNRATSALDELAGMVDDAARQIDDRLGPQYGQYARQAAGAVTGFADSFRNKDVDELFDDARSLIRKSPAVAIGIAAAVGFTLVRLVKAGTPEQPTDVSFTPDSGRDVQFVSDDVAASAGAGAAAGA